MNLTKKIILFCVILLLGACADYKTDKPKHAKERKFYSSKGFALIYSDSLFEQGGIDKKLNNNEIIDNKLNNEQIIALHSSLKKNTLIKIINPDTSIAVETKIFRKAEYPNKFNIVLFNSFLTDAIAKREISINGIDSILYDGEWMKTIANTNITSAKMMGVNLIYNQKINENKQIQDFPIFNGKYSTTCYIDETLQALDDMYLKRKLTPSTYMKSIKTLFLHRPYRRMPETTWATAYLFALSTGNSEERAEPQP